MAGLPRLLGQPGSINVRKLLWTAAELGLAEGRDFVREDWGGATRSPQAPQFTALNPHAMVPVWVQADGTARWESNSLCRWLVRQAGDTRLLPGPPWAAAQVEQWMDWQIAELNPAWRAAFLARVRGQPQPADAVAASLQAWNRQMARLEAQLQASGAHVTGGDFTLADVVLGLSAHRWRHTPMADGERPPLPAVMAWLDRLGQRPAAAPWLRPEVA